MAYAEALAKVKAIIEGVTPSGNTRYTFREVKTNEVAAGVQRHTGNHRRYSVQPGSFRFVDTVAVGSGARHVARDLTVTIAYFETSGTDNESEIAADLEKLGENLAYPGNYDFANTGLMNVRVLSAGTDKTDGATLSTLNLEITYLGSGRG